MNVSQIKGLTWLVASALTVGLFWYVFTSFTELRGRQRPFLEGSPEHALATEILHKPYVTDGPKSDMVAMDDVQRAFNELNWTGKAPPPPPPPPTQVEAPVEQPKTPVADLLKVLYIHEDVARPEHSQAYVIYRDTAGVKGVPKSGLILGIAERLAEPHSYAIVHTITAEDGVTFAFEDEARPKESVAPPRMNIDSQVAEVGPDGIILPARTGIQAFAGRRPPVSKQTQMVGKNRYALGTEDMFLLADDYPTIIAREVRHRRHRDPKTGKFDGIELQEVQPGGTVSRHGGESGDVVKSINGTPVTSVQEAITFVNNNKDKYSTWDVVIENRGQVRTVTYETPPSSEP